MGLIVPTVVGTRTCQVPKQNKCRFWFQFKIEPFKHPLKLDPNYAGKGWCCIGPRLQPFRPAAALSHLYTCEGSIPCKALSNTSWLPPVSENTWKILESAIGEINAHNASGLSYEELYR